MVKELPSTIAMVEDGIPNTEWIDCAILRPILRALQCLFNRLKIASRNGLYTDRVTYNPFRTKYHNVRVLQKAAMR